MNDTHETNLPAEENGKLEEAKAPEVLPEKSVEEVVSEESSDLIDSNVPVEEPMSDVIPVPENQVVEVKEEVVSAGETEPTVETKTEGNIEEKTSEAEIPVSSKLILSKDEILDKLSELLDAPADKTKNEVESLKQAFYKIHRGEVEELKKAFIESGGEEKDFIVPVDEKEAKLKELLAAHREKRSALHAQEEEQKAANYALKLQLIDRLKELSESQEDFNKLYNEFRDIQQRWKEVKLIPQEHANELWRNYQIYSEKFYDIIKINNQFRDYDFKKNLELKTALCESVEKLVDEPDTISAFHQLQKLHQQWREIGPVARELREEIWTRFKTASSQINKRYQGHFEEIKEKEQENLDTKIAICEQIENIDYEPLKSFKAWEEMNKFVIGLQDKWKTIGFAPKKHNVKVFERFRAACDVYFGKKAEFYKGVKDEMENNLQRKIALCEKAEELKNSTDWRDTTEKMIALQKEWKTIGSVARKHSDAIWKRFISACDYFFEQKNKNVSSQKGVEQENLAAKQALIVKVNEIDEALGYDEALAQLKEYMTEWNSIGFVPFREKDKIYKEYHEAIDKQFDRLKVDQADRKMQTYRNSLNDMTNGEKGKGKLYGERERLMRTYERMKNELQTYENNIGFLSISSKGGGGLLKEMERKIEKLKEDMELTVKKIEAIDENLD